MMRIEKTTTGCVIKEPSDEIKRKVLQYFSLKQPIREFFIYSGNDPDRPPIFGHERDVLYISSGFLSIEDPVIRKETRWKKEITPSNGKTISLGSTREPRSDLQRDCIKVLTTSNSHKITCELKPGVDLLPAPAYGDVREKYSPLNCWDEISNAYGATT